MGLAAPQVGVNVRVMVFNPTGRRGDEEITLVNPRLLSAGRERVLGEEGCLSFPRIFAPVEVRRAPRATSPVPGLAARTQGIRMAHILGELCGNLKPMHTVVVVLHSPGRVCASARA